MVFSDVYRGCVYKMKHFELKPCIMVKLIDQCVMSLYPMNVLINILGWFSVYTQIRQEVIFIRTQSCL